jgi:hypothetical protein
MGWSAHTGWRESAVRPCEVEMRSRARRFTAIGPGWGEAYSTAERGAIFTALPVVADAMIEAYFSYPFDLAPDLGGYRGETFL